VNHGLSALKDRAYDRHSMPTPETTDVCARGSRDFSLVLGGPLFQLLVRARLSGSTLQLAWRRVAAFVMIAWVPLLVLSAAEGNAWSMSSVEIPFLRDVEVHARLLVAMPVLIMAELFVHARMRPMLEQFLLRGIVGEADRPRFDAAIASALRWRNSVAAEILLILFVYVVGVGLVWRTQVALDGSSWYGSGVDGSLHPTGAGWWLGLVSLPLFQFLLLRWYYRFLIWARFLWQVSRLDLRLVPTHPDRCGGLGFLPAACYAFAPLLVAQGALLSGFIANRIFYAGAELPQFKVDIAMAVGIALLGVLGPLAVFAPRLAETKRKGLREYGCLAEQYARAFDRKWLRGEAPAGESLIGSADIQSLADLCNCFEVIQSMRPVPVHLQIAVRLSAATLAPLLPLAFTMISLDTLLDHVLRLAF
jgi:hypothetical protein